jgi:acyl-CoA reductase-like NAD-dependent aldehyde dehydrogenase
MTEMARHWIDGRWLESELVTDSYNPGYRRVTGRFADGGKAEARATVDAARRALAVTDGGAPRAAFTGAAGTRRVIRGTGFRTGFDVDAGER